MLSWIQPLVLAGLMLGVASPASAALWSEAGGAARGDGQARAFRADGAELRRLLALAPDERRGERGQVIELPLPDGEQARFRVVESPMMEPGLAERYPQLRTYRLTGVDDPLASGRALLDADGFSAMLHTPAGRVLIDSLAADAGELAVSVRYRRLDAKQAAELRAPLRQARADAAGRAALPAARVSGAIISYRLAVAATDNFVAAVGGTVADAQAEIVRTINRVNSIYERDLGIRLVLVANNDRLIEEEDSGCLVNNDPFTILPQNQRWIDEILGSGRYDVGHVFTTDPGGLASLDSVCVAGIKAQGTSGHGAPGGDDFYIDIVAHELGHQLGADHSFNGSTGACRDNRNDGTAFEPGSGSTIMSYAGLCGGENLQLMSDATFHAGSIAQIDAVTGSSGSCYATIPTGNSDPQLTGAADYSIPALTPFVLDNTLVSDADADTLSYQWDQMDSGAQTSAITFGRDNGDNVLFRAYPPRPDSYRNFPALGTQLDGLYDKAEVLPCSTRTLEFRLTARDNAGGQVTDDVTISVVDTGSAFRITAPNSAQTIINGSVDVVWDPADTDQMPINCATVDIDLLTFNDANFDTYSVHNLTPTGTPNIGNATVAFDPTLDADTARIRVQCRDNVFYDINDANLRIDGTGSTQFDFDDVTTYFNDDSFGTLGFTEPACGVPRPAPTAFAASAGERLVDPFAARPVPAPRLAAADCIFPDSVNGGKKDSSSVSLVWLLGLVSLVLGVRGWRLLRR